MSTASAAISPSISHFPHTPHAPHPIPLREHAFALHCQGLRSPAIAAELGVPERTIRSWISAALDGLKDDLQLSRKEQLLVAVERQNQLTVAAWRQFEREVAARDAFLETALDSLHAAADAADAPARPVTVRLPASTPAPRYLSLILQANKETNRLLGLHTLARLHLLSPDASDADPAPLANSDFPAESATAPHPSASSTLNVRVPAESATTAGTSPCVAESATPPSSPAPESGAASGWPPSRADSQTPAESATATNGVAASFQPAACQSRQRQQLMAKSERRRMLRQRNDLHAG